MYVKCYIASAVKFQNRDVIKARTNPYLWPKSWLLCHGKRVVWASLVTVESIRTELKWPNQFSKRKLRIKYVVLARLKDFKKSCQKAARKVNYEGAKTSRKAPQIRSAVAGWAFCEKLGWLEPDNWKRARSIRDSPREQNCLEIHRDEARINGIRRPKLRSVGACSFRVWNYVAR